MEPKIKIFSRETMVQWFAFCESKEIKDVDNFIYLCVLNKVLILENAIFRRNGWRTRKMGGKGGTVEKTGEVPIVLLPRARK